MGAIRELYGPSLTETHAGGLEEDVDGAGPEVGIAADADVDVAAPREAGTGLTPQVGVAHAPSLGFRRRDDGGLVIDVPPPLAEPLAALLTSLAATLRAAGEAPAE